VDPTKCVTCGQGPLAGVHMPDTDGYDHEFVKLRYVDAHPDGSVLTNRSFWKFIGGSLLVVLAMVALRYFMG